HPSPLHWSACGDLRFALREPPGSPRPFHWSACGDLRFALGEPPGSPKPPPLVRLRQLAVRAGGTSPFPPTPCTGPLRGQAPSAPDQRFADPVALSSTRPVDLPAPPCGFPVQPPSRAST